MRLSKLKVACEELYASFSSLGIRKVKSIEQFKQSIDTHYPLVKVDDTMFNITIKIVETEYEISTTHHCHIRIKKQLLNKIEEYYPEALV